MKLASAPPTHKIRDALRMAQLLSLITVMIVAQTETFKKHINLIRTTYYDDVAMPA